uniref:Ovule protein n=1 Tax=Meloidogyne hapla TaxID=6305 RepID=A0A1I8BY61_MELHA
MNKPTMGMEWMSGLNSLSYKSLENGNCQLTNLQMSGYIDGLRTTARPEERDSEDSSDQPTSSISLII